MKAGSGNETNLQLPTAPVGSCLSPVMLKFEFLRGFWSYPGEANTEDKTLSLLVGAVCIRTAPELEG